MNVLEREAVRTTAMILAAEDWPKIYNKAPKQHAALIQNQAQMQLILTKFFKSMAAKANDFVNWDHYNFQVKQASTATLDKLDFNVETIINDDQLDEFDGLFIQLNLKTVNNLITAGAQSGEVTYGRPLGIQSHDAIIQSLSTKQVAALVGKTVKPDGTFVDNPNSAYNITDTVREDIAQGIKTSLALGETTEQATARIADIIGADGYRAERIANTEAVNAYNAGITEFGNQSGATGMEWEDAGADDECAEYAAMGIIPFDGDWDGLDGPPAHPNCRCAKRLVYKDEMDEVDDES